METMLPGNIATIHVSKHKVIKYWSTITGQCTLPITMMLTNLDKAYRQGFEIAWVVIEFESCKK